MPLFYVLIALLTATNFFYKLEESIYVSISRIVFIIVVIICGFSRKIWLTYVLIIMWLITLIFRGTIVSRGI